MNLRKLNQPAHMALLSLTLAACGGGGGGSASTPTSLPATASTPTPAPAPAPTPAPTPAPSGAFGGAGIYKTKTMTPTPYIPYTAYVTILESGEYFSVDVDPIYESLLNGGMEHGTVTDGGGTFSSSDTKIFIFGMHYVPSAVQLSGSYNGASFATDLAGNIGTYHNVGSALTYSDQDTRTIYSNPIAMSDIAGSFSGTMSWETADGLNAGNVMDSFSVGADGSFNGSTSLQGCSVSGTMTRHGNTGVFDLSANITGSGCKVAGAVKGIATPRHWGSDAKQIYFQLYSSDYAQAVVLAITKS